MTEFFTMGLRQPPPPLGQAQAIMAGVGAAAWALWKVSGERWLLVTGRRVPGRDGLATTVRRFEVETLDEAREAMATEVGRARSTKAVADEVTNMLRDYKRRGGSTT